MQRLIIRFSFISIACLALQFCRKASLDSNAKAQAEHSQGAALLCSNKNILWRFLKTGAIECKQSLAIDFTDDKTGKPLIGALYRVFIDVYLQIPIKQFFSVTNIPSRTIELPEQTAFVRVQLADDPQNKNPIFSVGKVVPKVTYSLKGLCDVKIVDFGVKVTAIKAPDLGNFASRSGLIAESIVQNYKSEAIDVIQKQLDSIGRSRLCWGYRKIFYREDSNKELESLAPQGAEQETADRILKGAATPPEAEKSEIEGWNADKFKEFEKQWSCAWAGSCP